MLNEDIHRVIQKYSYLLLSETALQNKDAELKEIGCLTEHFEEFLLSQPNAVSSRSCVLLKLTELIVSFGLVQPFQEPEDRDFSESDFPVQAQYAEDCFKYLSSLLAYYDSIETSCKRKFLVQVLMLSGTHHDKFMWSSEKCAVLSADFISTLLTLTKHKSLSDLLTDDTFHPTIFKALLRRMRPSLLKETWMKNPSSCHVFYWLLSHVKHPYLVDYLPDVLPPSFMFSSYHSVPQIILGVKCFDHILDNVPPTLIKSDGTEEVIFDLLKKISHFNKEKELIESIYPCLLKLPIVNSEKADQTKWLPYDIILQHLLENAAMESNPKLRSIYLSQIHLFVSAAPCFKHLSKALDVVFNNLSANSIAEEDCRIISLKTMKEIIKSCWPRIENHFLQIMVALLKVMYDIENTDESIEKDLQVLSLCKESIQMLKYACPESFKAAVSDYLQCSDHSLPAASFIETLIEN